MSKVADAPVTPRSPPPPSPDVAQLSVPNATRNALQMNAAQVNAAQVNAAQVNAAQPPLRNARDDASSFTRARDARTVVAQRRPAGEPPAPGARSMRSAPVVAPAPAPAPAAAHAPRAPAEPFGRASSGAVRLSRNDLGVIPQDQGNTNACGTTSLANVMTHFGMPRTHQQIDRGIRAFDMFTAPDRIADFARASGMRASLKNEATMNDLTRMIDQGVPPIVLYDPDEGDDAGLHYATVTGYNRGADGNVSNVVLANSAGGERQVMPADEFQRRWSNLQLHNVNTGMSNMMISAVPNDGRAIVGGDGRTRPAASITLPRATLGGALRSTAARSGAQLISDAAVSARAARDGAEMAADATVGAARWTRDRVTTGATVGAAVIGVGARRLWRSLFE